MKSYLRSREKQLVYLISLLATLGSLSVSEIFGWTPFTLSILQRIFMYPIILISGIAITLKNSRLYVSSLFLAILGLLASSIHLFILLTTTWDGCGFALPCTTINRIVIFDIVLNPIYLPLMALIAFSAIIITISTNKKNREQIIRLINNLLHSEIRLHN